jgi:hypothetical protein
MTKSARSTFLKASMARGEVRIECRTRASVRVLLLVPCARQAIFCAKYEAAAAMTPKQTKARQQNTSDRGTAGGEADPIETKAAELEAT